MKFSNIVLPEAVLARLGLPDIPYEVPAVIHQHVGVDVNDPPLAAMLFALQTRAEDDNADWLKIAPAMEALTYALSQEGWPAMLKIDQPDFTICLDHIDPSGDVIAVQRQGRIVAFLAQAGGGRVKAQLFHPPCARTIRLLIDLGNNADDSSRPSYYGSNWDRAQDAAAGNGQYYAAVAGRAYLASWLFGVGIDCDLQPLKEWVRARDSLQPWPQENQAVGAVAINAFVKMGELIQSLPQDKCEPEELPAFCALPKAAHAAPDLESPLPLNTYNLSQPEGRFALLWALYNDYQEDGLLMAVNHVWNCLDKPRSARCALMAQKVGKTGTGRKALLRFFRRFLDETLYEFEVPDLPDRDTYDRFEDWSADCLAHFERLDKRMSAIIARYEAILDGRDPNDVTELPMGVVIKGPWGRESA